MNYKILLFISIVIILIIVSVVCSIISEKKIICIMNTEKLYVKEIIAWN